MCEYYYVYQLSKGLLAMTVSAVGQNENSKLYTVVKTTAVGAALGYASKYMLPVTKQEDTISKRTMINYCRKVTNKAKVAEIKAEGVKSRAQDVFVKMIESKDKDAFACIFLDIY